MASSDKVTIIIEAKDQASGVFKKAGSSLGSMAKLAGGAAVAGVAGLAAGLGFLGVKAISAGSDAEEMLSKFNAVFKDFSGATQNELADFASAIGRNRFDLMEYAATLQDTFVPLGFARGEAADMSVQMVKLAEDLASFNNLNTADVVRDLQSAMVGNTETLRKYGVVAQQAQIEEFALANGIWDGEEAMSAQQKTAAILGITLASTTDAQGDAARTADGWANQMRALKSTIAETVTQIGQGLLPVVKPFLSFVGSLARNIGQKLVGALQKIQPFLELLGEGFSDILKGDFHGGLQKIQGALVNMLMSLGASEGVIDFFRDLLTVIRSFIGNLQEGMSPVDAFIEAIWDVAPPGVGMALADIRDSVSNLITKVKEFLTPILEWVQNTVQLKDVLIGLAIVLGGVVLSAIVSIVASMAPVILIVGGIILAVALLRTAWEEDWGGIQAKVTAVIEFIRGFIEGALTFIKEFWAANGDEIMAKATAIWEGIKAAVSTAITIIQTVITTIVTAIKDFWAQNGDQILATAQTIWTTIQNVVQTVITTIQNVITTVVTAITAFWDQHGQTILTTAQTVWNAIQTAIQVVLDVVKSIFQAFKSAFEGDWRGFGENLREAWDKAWEAIRTALANIIPKLIEAVKGLIDKVITKFTETDWLQVGKDIIQGVADGISAATGFIVDAAKKAAGAALDAVKGFLGIDSPSKLFQTEVGWAIPEGAAVGIMKNLSPIDKAMKDMKTRMMAGMTDLAGGIQSAVGPSAGRSQLGPVSAFTGQPMGGERHYHLHLGTVPEDVTIIDDFRLAETLGRES